MNVVDLHGRPVTGLTKSDFRLFEDGVEQKITNFYVVENSAPRPLAQATATTSTAAAPVAPDPQFRRKVVLLVDNNFINNIELNAALRTLDQQIETKYSGDYEWSVSAIGHALEIVQPFTSDKRLIHAAIKKVEHMPRIDPESVLKGRERFLDPLLLSEDQAFVVVRAGGLRVVRGYGACAS